MGSWSELANDMLEQVTGLLSLADQHRFSAVCHNWRLVAKHRRKVCRPEPLPWLVLGEDRKSKKRNFFSMSEQRIYSIDIPELYGQFICGSSYGWLVIVDSKTNGRLLNPFTKECYQLPPFPPYKITKGGVIQESLVYKAILSHDPSQDKDFVVIIVFGDSKQLAIWRPSDTNWTMMDGCGFVDMIYFQGLLYAVCQCSDLVCVYDVGIGSNTSVVGYLGKGGGYVTPDRIYLLVFKGEFLLLKRHEDLATYETDGFLVQTYDRKGERWCELGNIDGHAVFVGNNSPIIVNPPPSGEWGGCIRNAIYFSDARLTYFWRSFGHDFGVYDMVEDTILLREFSSSTSSIFNYHRVFHPPDAALTWFTPSPQ